MNPNQPPYAHPSQQPQGYPTYPPQVQSPPTYPPQQPPLYPNVQAPSPYSPPYSPTFYPSAPPSVPSAPPIQSPLPPHIQSYPTGEHPIHIAQFVVTEKECAEKFKGWVNELWFAPTGFKRAASSPPFQQRYIPFYVCSVSTRVFYEGMAGYTQHNHHTNREERSWHKASGTRSEIYTDVLMCADANPEICTLMNKFSRWNIGSTVPTLTSVLTSSMHIVDDAIPLANMWKDHAEPKIRKEEEQKCLAQFKHETKAQEIIDFHPKITYANHFERMVYLPVWYSVFNYENKELRFVVNGQTGDFDGERPEYGLGKLGDVKKGFINVVGTLTGQKEETALIAGDKLAQKDGWNVYNPHSYYVVFPRSDSMLITEATGWIKLKNNGSYPIELYSQKRRGAKRGLVFTLDPGASQAFDYKGHWCIEILRGYPADLQIEGTSTSGGGKGNKLGMV